jgi:hypothetical protein
MLGGVGRSARALAEAVAAAMAAIASRYDMELAQEGG